MVIKDGHSSVVLSIFLSLSLSILLFISFAPVSISLSSLAFTSISLSLCLSYKKDRESHVCRNFFLGRERDSLFTANTLLRLSRSKLQWLLNFKQHLGTPDQRSQQVQFNDMIIFYKKTICGRQRVPFL